MKESMLDQWFGPAEQEEEMSMTDEERQTSVVDDQYFGLDVDQEKRRTMLMAAVEALPDADIRTQIVAAHWIEHGTLPAEAQ